jgi:hypothetical protein
MSLDERYGCSVSLSPLFAGISSPPSAAQWMLLQPAFSGPLSFASRSWSPTAPIPLGPQIVNRWRAVAPQDLATPGTDRVRQECATTGLQIPLEPQLGESVVSLGSSQGFYGVYNSCTKGFKSDTRKIRVSKSPYGRI